MVITPPHMQLQVEELVSAGWLPIITVGEPGAQGALVTGMQGWGVRTPMAAEVAAATWGLERLMHMPKVGMFIIGMWSMMLAAGTPPTMTRLAGSTVSEAGATSKLHAIMAPETTSTPIFSPPSRAKVGPS